MQTVEISASVGSRSRNDPSDVKTIQQALNQFYSQIYTTTVLHVDGIVGAKTIAWIKAFQRDFLKIPSPEGRIEPNDRTILALTSNLSHLLIHFKSTITYQLSDKGINFLKSIEELKLKPYDDQTGKEISSWVEGATIGYGHLISKVDWSNYKSGISKTQAEELFKKDLIPYVDAIKSKVKTKVLQNQFDALVLLTFNIGIGSQNTGFSGSSVLKLINDPKSKTRYSSLEDAWKAWNKSQGILNKGLINRRNAEWNIYSKNIYEKW